MMIPGAGAAFLAALLTLAPALPAAAQDYASDTMMLTPPVLKAGQFVWYEQPEMVKASLGEAAPVSIVVSIAAQQAYVFRGSKLVAVTTVSTGSPGHETPVGEFTILQKKVFHRSNLYSNAPMPYMQRLTWSGIALHAGHLPGYPASHGCIRMPKAFARQLYELTAMGGEVSVVDDVYADPRFYPPIEGPAPLLTAETRNLGGGAFDVVTMRGDAPRIEVRPASWVTGPRKEIVQPIRRTRGSR